MTNPCAADTRLIALYRDMLPRKIFDAHMHVWGEGTVRELLKKPNYNKEILGVNDYLEDLTPLYPGVEEIRVNAIPMPDASLPEDPEGIREKMNKKVTEEVSLGRAAMGTGFILPSDSENTIETIASTDGIKAFKCYCFSRGASDCNTMEIGDFLPEAAFPVMERHKIPVIIHMMRDALADEKNLNYIRTMAKRYPDAKLILAHSARGFAAYSTVKYLPMLSDLDNIYTDIAAINEPAAIMAALKYSKKKTLFGTDYPVCLYRGRAISFTDGFAWLIEDAAPKEPSPAIMAAEELFAIYQSALLMDLDATDIEDLFYNNALRAFNIKKV